MIMSNGLRRSYKYLIDQPVCRVVVRLVAASAAALASVVALDRSDEVSIGCMFAVLS